MPIIERLEVGDPCGPEEHRDFIDITHPQRRAELLRAVERGINTMADIPPWILELYRELKGEHDAVVQR